MVDLPVPEGESRAAAARGQRFWGVLLVLDSFFVIIFGGALSAKLYQHWTPVPEPPAMRRRPRPLPKAAEAKPEQVKPEAKAPEPAPAPKPAAAVPPPKPALVQEPPRRESPGLQAAAKTPEAKPVPAPPGAKPKALPVDFKVKFPGARKVDLAGAFIVRGGRKPMNNEGAGVWTITVYLMPNSYRYHFIVDGKRKLDPANPKQERGSSVVTVP